MDIDNLTTDEKVEIILKKLNTGGDSGELNFYDLKRVTDDDELVNKLKVKTIYGDLTDSIDEYIDSYSKDDSKFSKHIEGNILPMVTLNPHDKPNPFKPFFADKDSNDKTLSHLQQLYDLLEKDENTGNINLVDYGNILHIGEKGSGKTLSQNVWLYDKNDILEKNKIFWVRLDATKIIQIWKDGNASFGTDDFLITPEIYFLGQLVYVFIKHFQKEFSNLYSELFGEIADKLKNGTRNNLQNINSFKTETITKAYAHAINIDTLAVTRYAKSQNIETIIDFLKHFEHITAVSEGTYDENGETRRYDKERKYKDSFLVEYVFLDSQKKKKQTELFSVWISIAKILQEFILNNDYKLFYIIDGLDNINFYYKEKENYIDKLLHLLLEFPLKIGHKNELLLISLRDTTYSRLKEIGGENFYYDRQHHRNLYTFHIIRQQTRDVLKYILEKRINYIFSEYTAKSDCFMAKVLKTINESQKVGDKMLEGEIWHYNTRGFLFNYSNLAKYITFKYYFAKTKQFSYFDIGRQISIYKDINLLLNGQLYVCEKARLPNTNEGTIFINLFGYTINEDEKPPYFIYTYILLLLKNRESIPMEKIQDILLCFGISEIDCKYCVDKLVSSGMLKQKFSSDVNCMKHEITNKGKLALQKFYNDIHFLYYTALDTKVPEKVLKSFRIAPNNLNTDEKRNYPLCCVITGIKFLNYLILQYNKTLNDPELKDKLNKLKIPISLFKIPIEKSTLSESIKTMVNIMDRDESSMHMFTTWLSHEM